MVFVLYTHHANRAAGNLRRPAWRFIFNRGHRSAAGFRYANPVTSVQFRLAAPIFMEDAPASGL